MAGSPPPLHHHNGSKTHYQLLILYEAPRSGAPITHTSDTPCERNTTPACNSYMGLFFLSLPSVVGPQPQHHGDPPSGGKSLRGNTRVWYSGVLLYLHNRRHTHKMLALSSGVYLPSS